MNGKYGIRCYCGESVISWAANRYAFESMIRDIGWSPNAEGKWRCPEHVFHIYAERRENERNTYKA